ncbi:hypothetical protein ACSVBT_09395 [Afipia sp. TerB]
MADDDSSGWMSRLLAEEDEFDRRTLWRLGSWAAVSVGAVAAAFMATHWSGALRRDQAVYADLLKQSQQVQWIARESQDETRRLAAAIDTLNGDRDRLYSRVTVLEQDLNSVTGAVSHQAAAPVPVAWPEVSMPPVLALPDLTRQAHSDGALPTQHSQKTPTESKAAPKSASTQRPSVAPVTTATAAELQPATGKPAESRTESGPAVSSKPEPHLTKVASLSAASDSNASPAPVEKVIEHTEFGIDIGSANSVEGLRTLWRGVTKSHSALLASLEPIIVVRERNDGPGMRLHLVAGPLSDAAAAAKLCAGLIEGKRGCEPTIFDGQRLDMDRKKPAKTTRHKRHRAKEAVAEPAPAPPPPPPQRGLSSILGFRSN